MYITDAAWQGALVTSYRQESRSAYSKPPPASWRVWQLSISKAFPYRGRCLHSPLGPWLIDDTSWEWYTSGEGVLFQRMRGNWFSFPPSLWRRRLPAFSRRGTPWDPLSPLLYASIYYAGNNIICSGSSPIICQTPAPPSSALEYILSDPPSLWCFHNLSIADDGSLFITALAEGDAIAVSDGSFKDTYGTATWVLEGNESAGRISGRVVCPDGASDQSSYCSELCGVYAVLTVVNNLCNYFQVKEDAITIGCDGLSALNSAFDSGDDANLEKPDFDIIAAICAAHWASPITWTKKKAII